MIKLLSTIFCAAFMLMCVNVATAQVKKKTTSKTVVKKVAPKYRLATTRSTKVIKDSSIKIEILTDSGLIVVKLYDSTPLHRDNFVKLVEQGFYDSLLFHRIIQGFMIQGGDPGSKTAMQGQQLGGGGGDMARIPAEFRPSLIHKKGALAAARDGNAEKASSACQFYIVQGNKYTDAELNMFETRAGIKYTLAQRLAYKTIGGTPMLDQNYTVYGEVIKGLAVIDKIAAVQKDGTDRPIGNVKMSMKVLGRK